MNSYSVELIKFTKLDAKEVRCLLLWFDDIKERFDVDVCYENTIIDEDYCNLSFMFKKFKVEIQGDYVELTLHKHPTEYYTIYKMDFDEIIFK